MLWIKEVELVDSVDELRTLSSIRGISMPNFEVLDARLLQRCTKSSIIPTSKEESVWRNNALQNRETNASSGHRADLHAFNVKRPLKAISDIPTLSRSTDLKGCSFARGTRYHYHMLRSRDGVAEEAHLAHVDVPLVMIRANPCRDAHVNFDAFAIRSADTHVGPKGWEIM